MSQRPSITDRRRTFRALHDSGCFVLPNPWDLGTTRFLQHLGFKALATSSASFAHSRGLPDAGVGRDVMLAHIAEIVAATDLPVNADYENGFGDTPDAVGENVRLCVDAGIAGLSIEDATGEPDRPLYPCDDAVARLRAARTAIDRSGADIVLTGRAECFLVGRPDLDETLARLRAYAEAGADCLYAPGLRSRAQIEAVVAAVAPKPVNVLVSAASDLAMPDLVALGVRRVSVGSTLGRVAYGAFMRSAREIAETGRFDSFAAAVPYAEINGFFRDDATQRQVEADDQ